MRRSSLVASRSLQGPVLGSLVLSALLMLVPSMAAAQAVTGTLLGNITDSSGAAVPGATVTATDVGKNISRNVVTNEAGYYIFTSLPNGNYTVEAELQGFKKMARQNVKVDVNTTVRVDLALEVGTDDRRSDRRGGDARCCRRTGPTRAASSSPRWCRNCRSRSIATSRACR